MQLVTRQIPNPATGVMELWLGDSSRKLTAAEVDALAAVTRTAQAEHAWLQQAELATDLGPLIAMRWSAEHQAVEVWQADGARRIPDAELARLREQVLARRHTAPTGVLTFGNP